MLRPALTGPAPPLVGIDRSFRKIEVPVLVALALVRSLSAITGGFGSRWGGGGGAGTGVGAGAETEGWASTLEERFLVVEGFD
jgi:hypothetical protein